MFCLWLPFYIQLKVTTRYPLEVTQTSSCLHYTIVLDLIDIMFPMTLNQIRKFKNLNDISINVYLIEEQKEIFPLRLTDRKKDKHVNLLYVQDPCHGNTGHFASNASFWNKNLSHLVRSQITVRRNRIYFCNRFVYI